MLKIRIRIRFYSNFKEKYFLNDRYYSKIRVRVGDRNKFSIGLSIRVKIRFRVRIRVSIRLSVRVIIKVTIMVRVTIRIMVRVSQIRVRLELDFG